MENIYVFWYRGGNFGDEINKYIWSNLLSETGETLYVSPHTASILGCGSILENVLDLGNNTVLQKIRKAIYPPLSIISTGMSYQRNLDYRRKDWKTLRKVKIYALRGMLSKISFQDMTGIDCSNVVLGDIGLLADTLLEGTVEKKYELGIVPHYAEQDNALFEKLKNCNCNSIIIDVNMHPKEFVKTIASCKRIASSAMHPLILANSLNIPCLWIEKSVNFVTSKFDDYFSAFTNGLHTYTMSRVKQSDISFEENYLIELIDRTEQIPYYIIENKKKELKEVITQVKLDVKEQRKTLGYKIMQLENHNKAGVK